MSELAQRLFNTVEFLEANGLDTSNLQVSSADKKAVRAVFTDSPTGDPKDVNTPARALMLKALLDEYDFDVIRNAQQLRSYIKLKLLELSTSNQEKTQLKALDMLARKLTAYMSDIIDVDTKDVLASYDPLPNAPAVEVIDLDVELGEVVLDDEGVDD